MNEQKLWLFVQTIVRDRSSVINFDFVCDEVR